MNSCKIIFAVLACITFQFSFSYFQEQKIETVIQTGHYASVTSVAFSPDGKFAATGSSDKTIKLWEVPTGREIRSYLNNNVGYTIPFTDTTPGPSERCKKSEVQP